MKAIKDYDVDEVAIWLNCIGLGDHAGPFRENDIDGKLLASLTSEDLTGDLGLSHLQAKKLQRHLEFTTELTGGGGGAQGDEAAAKIKELDAEVAQLKEENAQLKAATQDHKAAPPPPDPHRMQQEVRREEFVGGDPFLREEVRRDVRRDEVRHDVRRDVRRDRFSDYFPRY
jgi:hypothetical protein